MTALALNPEQSAVITKTDATLESAYADGVTGPATPLPPMTGYVQSKPIDNPPNQPIQPDTVKTMIKNPFKSTLSALLGACSTTPPIWTEITALTGGFNATAPDAYKKGLFYSIDPFGWVTLRGAITGSSSSVQITQSIPQAILPAYNRPFVGVAGTQVALLELIPRPPDYGFLQINSSYSAGAFIFFEFRYFPGD